ncbi:MAG: hypothetical protein ACFB20_04935 [Opitutales bacterium]
MQTTTEVSSMLISSPQTSVAYGAPCYWLRGDRIELFVTARGGHLGPTSFKLKHRWVRPLSLPPWQPEDLHPELPVVLQNLRGDFLGLPFGENHAGPPHGEPANAEWSLVGQSFRELRLALDLQSPRGRIEKTLTLGDNERALYQQHVIEGVQGRLPLGQHAILEFPEDAPGHVSVAPFAHGQVTPLPFNNPAQGDYGSLQPGATFDSLESVPLRDGGTTSLASYPAREGFEDLAMVSSQPEGLGWTAAVLDGYIFLSLKNLAVLPSTLLWFSNGGRWQAPWQGRHRRRLGLEEVCSYFNGGIDASRRNPLQEQGIPTVRRFSRREATVVRVAQVVHPVAKDFGAVATVTPTADKPEVIAANACGQSVAIPVHWSWVLDSP